jgi:hypothetical protein
VFGLWPVSDFGAGRARCYLIAGLLPLKKLAIGKSVAQNLNTTHPLSLSHGSASLASTTVAEMRKPNLWTASAAPRESLDKSARDSSNTSPGVESSRRLRQYDAWVAMLAHSASQRRCSFFTSRGERFVMSQFCGQRRGNRELSGCSEAAARDRQEMAECRPKAAKSIVTLPTRCRASKIQTRYRKAVSNCPSIGVLGHRHSVLMAIVVQPVLRAHPVDDDPVYKGHRVSQTRFLANQET